MSGKGYEVRVLPTLATGRRPYSEYREDFGAACDLMFTTIKAGEEGDEVLIKGPGSPRPLLVRTQVHRKDGSSP